MSDVQWSLQSSEQIFETSSKGLRVLKRTYTSSDGRKKTAEIKDEGPFGNAFALTPDNKVILIRQFRIGPDKYYFESPAGSLSAEADPQKEVMREVLEETGYTPGEVIHLRTAHDMAYSTAVRHLYLAKNCIKTHSQSLDEDEFIDNIVLATIPEVIEMIKRDEYMYPLLAYLAFDKLGVLHWDLK